ncbi:hypothetical protein N7470_003574 [Penicillium chermesinum]|nr:hypothetical protein N7470_003574 [Penicillium chermesinum]
MRSNIIKLHFENQTTPQQRAYVSALSGGISGGVVTRLMAHNLFKMTDLLSGGRLVPGLVVFSLLGYGGQTAFNKLDAWQMEKAQAPH